MELSFQLPTPEDTARFATAFSSFLEPGMIVGLRGELGAGKTTFVKAIGAALGVEGEIQSPTFVLQSIYDVPETTEKLSHWDLYRVRERGDELLREIIEEAERGATVFVEWPERSPALLEQCDLLLQFLYSGEGRMVSISGNERHMEKFGALMTRDFSL